MIQIFLWQKRLIIIFVKFFVFLPLLEISLCGKDPSPSLGAFGKTHGPLAETWIRSFCLSSLTQQKIRVRSLSESWVWSHSPCPVLGLRSWFVGVCASICSSRGRRI